MDPYDEKDSEEGDEKDFQDEVEYLDNEEAKVFPHDCIGLVKFRNKHNHSLVGTGFLIASDLVLTVAHNIYSQK
jgi:V8-like Glu-specific endopeptidase